MSNEAKKDITLKIQSTRGTREFTYPQQTKISQAIADAVAAFGFAAGDRFELVLASNQEVLQPERTLVSYKIENGAVLILTSIGGGV